MKNVSTGMYKKRVFIYVRVSTNRQAEEGYSIQQQIDRLQKYCDAMGWQLVKIYTDDGYSGGSLDRPAMNNMIQDIEAGNADIVLVDKLDRLSRSQFDTLYMIQKVFDAHDVAFVSRNEAFDTSTPFGKAMVGILAVFAELERSRIKERMKDGQEGRAKEGKYKGGGKTPIGYNYDKPTGELVINEYEAMQVREAFQMYINRVPIYQIWKTFSEKGYQTKYGVWKEQTIRYMFGRRVYIGDIEFSGNVYEGQHEAIIDMDTWRKAEKVTKERAIENEYRTQGRAYRSPLGGLMFCANCGARYHFRAGQKRKDGTRRNYYLCYSRSKADKSQVKDPNCRNKNYRDDVLDAIIFDEIRKLKSDPSYIPAIQGSIDNSKRIETISKRVKQIDAQISKFMDLYAITDMDVSEITAKVAPLSEEKKSLVSELETLNQQAENIPQDDIISLVDTFERMVDLGDQIKIHDAIAELIDRIEIDGEDVRIHWSF